MSYDPKPSSDRDIEPSTRDSEESPVIIDFDNQNGHESLPTNQQYHTIKLSQEDTGEHHQAAVEVESSSEPRSSVDFDPMELSAIIAMTDIGSYMMKKLGKAGESPELDQLPYFASMRRRWYFMIWEGNPSEWRLVSTKDRIEDPYIHNFKNEELPIYLKDITDIYLEPPPHLGIRLYRNNEVIQLSPLSYSLSESTAWADAFRAAFTLQDMPSELVMNVRQQYYEMLSLQPAPVPSNQRNGGDLEVYQEEEEEIVLGGEHTSTLSKSKSSQSKKELLEPPPDHPPVAGVSGCFYRWFGKKSS